MIKTQPWPDDTDYEANPSANAPSAEWIGEYEASHNARDKRKENFNQRNWAKLILSKIVQEGAPPAESGNVALPAPVHPLDRSFAAQMIGQYLDSADGGDGRAVHPASELWVMLTLRLMTRPRFQEMPKHKRTAAARREAARLIDAAYAPGKRRTLSAERGSRFAPLHGPTLADKDASTKFKRYCERLGISV